jgi:hypothetical protein
MYTAIPSRVVRLILALVAAVLVTTALAANAFALPPEGGEPPEEPSPVPTQPAPPSGTPAIDKWFTVNESDFDVETWINLRDNDRVLIRASGAIKSGVFLGGWSGPNGWNNIDCDRKFPLPCSHPYALLKRVGSPDSTAGYSFIGAGTDFRYRGANGEPLALRINDDLPGNGEGSFSVNVRVYR